jgi:hypothetical protein
VCFCHYSFFSIDFRLPDDFILTITFAGPKKPEKLIEFRAGMAKKYLESKKQTDLIQKKREALKLMENDSSFDKVVEYVCLFCLFVF